MVSKEKQREMRLSHHLSSIRTGQMPSNIQSSLVSYSDRFVTFFITRTIQINIIILIPFMQFLFYSFFLTTKMPIIVHVFGPTPS